MMWRHALLLPILAASMEEQNAGGTDPAAYLTDANNCSEQVCLAGTFVAKLAAHSNLQCMEVCGKAHHGFKSKGMGRCTHFTFSPEGECLIYSSCETLGVGAVTFGTGASKYTITDTASFKTCLSPWREEIVDDWVLIAQQNWKIHGAGFPGHVRSSFKHNEDNPESPSYMVIGNMDKDDWKGEDDKYKFKLYFFNDNMDESGAQVLQWKQGNWLTDDHVSGAEGESPSNIFTARTNCAQFKGLARSGDGCAVIDGNGKHSCWFHPIGGVCKYGAGLPAWNQQQRKQMKLFIWGNPMKLE